MSRSPWDGLARVMAASYHLDPVMAEHKRRVHLDMLRRWGSLRPGARVLKTDLFEEALGPDEVLLSWPEGSGGVRVLGVDVSREICARARARFAGAGRNVVVVGSDALRLPFGDGSLDLVYSCSTLDQLETREELLLGLHEAARVLRPGGLLILTLDNPRTLFYPLARWLGRDGKFGFPIGSTLAPDEFDRVLRDCGFQVVDRRGIHHVPRVVFTGWLRALRVLRLNALAGAMLGILRMMEKRTGSKGQYWTAWYVACLAKRRAGG